MEEDEYDQAYTELEGEQNQASTELRRIVNTLGLPEEREKAIERAQQIIAEQVTLVEFVKRIGEKLDDKDDLTDIQKAQLKNVISKAVLFDFGRMETGEDVRDAVFRMKRKLLDDLILTGGEIKLSKDKIDIEGLIREDTLEFTRQIIGTANNW